MLELILGIIVFLLIVLFGWKAYRTRNYAPFLLLLISLGFFSIILTYISQQRQPTPTLPTPTPTSPSKPIPFSDRNGYLNDSIQERVMKESEFEEGQDFGKKKYCLVGSYNGEKGCALLQDESKCASGRLFATETACLKAPINFEDLV